MRDSSWGCTRQGEILDSCGKTVDNLWKSMGMREGELVEGDKRKDKGVKK